MTTFTVESWEQVRNDVIRHWPEHYNEAHGDGEFNPDIEAYDAMASWGKLLALMVRRDDRLVGYSVSLMPPNLLARHITMGVIDSYWLAKPRRPTMFPRLMMETLVALRDRGVRRVMAVEPAAGTMLSRMGFRSTERVWIKDI